MSEERLAELEALARRCSFDSFPEYECIRSGLLELIAAYRGRRRRVVPSPLAPEEREPLDD